MTHQVVLDEDFGTLKEDKRNKPRSTTYNPGLGRANVSAAEVVAEIEANRHWREMSAEQEELMKEWRKWKPSRFEQFRIWLADKVAPKGFNTRRVGINFDVEAYTKDLQKLWVKYFRPSPGSFTARDLGTLHIPEVEEEPND